MNIQEKSLPGGLQASRHTSEHPQSTQNTSDPRGVQREGGYQPPSQSAPRRSLVTTNGPRGHNDQRKALQKKDTTEKDAN